MLKKAGAEGVSLSVMRTRSQQAAADKAPEVTVINKNLTLGAGKAEYAAAPLTELLNDPQRRKSLNQSLASKSSGSKVADEVEVEDYMEITELTDFEEITFDPMQMTAIIDKEENITFTQDTLSNASHDNYSISFAADAINNDEITFSEGSNSCTFKIEYPISETSSLNQSEENSNSNSGNKPFACRHCGKEYRWKSTLRRHENVECGGKAPSYECPYCEYKAKQRGNLGVHVRKHHPDLPKLESRRKKHD